MSFLPFYKHDWWYGYCENYPDVTTGVVRNYTEIMLLNIIDWTKRSFAVDNNRFFMQGGSMGGTGTVSFGLRHPEIFAAVYATVPQVNPAMPCAGFRGELDDIWGAQSANLPTNDGPGVWDRMNMPAYVRDNVGDMPFLKVQNSKNDTILPWCQIPDFYKNLNASRHGFIAAWGQGGHNNSSSGLPAEYAYPNVYDLRLNRSFVVASNSSTNNNPGNGDVNDGDSVGQMNSGYTQTILSDTTTEWSASIRYATGADVTADISARRLQQFRCDAGRKLCWVLKDQATGDAICFGMVNAERANFFVIPHLPFNGSNRVLTVYKASSHQPEDIRTIDPGDDISLDLMRVTGVFTDKCYAQSLDRVIGITLNPSGLSEGDLIDISGKKGGSVTEWQITDSSVKVLAKNAVPEPVGLPDGPLTMRSGWCTEGVLVKFWGKVDGETDGGYYITDGINRYVVWGNRGNKPQDGSYISITGISAGIIINNQLEPGIRIRKPEDVGNI